MIFKFAYRNFKKRLFLNLIKALGLSLAFCSLLFIVLFLKNEITFDRSFSKADRIYRFTITHPTFLGGKEFARTHNTQYLTELKESFPEVENYVRLAPSWSNIKKDGKVITVNQSFICDTSYFQVFDTPIIAGDAKGTHNSLYISEKLAARIYGEASPIGQILEVPVNQYGEETASLKISGVIKDNPQNSHFHPELLYLTSDNQRFNNWAYTYLLLAENADPSKIIAGFKEFFVPFSGDADGNVLTDAHLQRITDIHLNSDKLREIEPNSNKTNIYVLAASALVLLMIALSNYISLNTGMSGFNDKYFYISKFLGSSSGMIFKYILSEGVIILLFSLAFTLLIALPAFQLIQSAFAIDLFRGNATLMLIVVAILAMLTLLASFLPELGRMTTNSGNKPYARQKGINKSLIVLQYSFSVVLIVAVIVISRQTDFVLKSSLGSASENMISIKNPKSGQPEFVFETFKNEIKNLSAVKSVSAMFTEFGGETNDMFNFELEGYGANNQTDGGNYVPVFTCDHDFIDFFNIPLLAGSDFSENNLDQEGSGEFIINESALKFFNYTNPDEIIGKQFGFANIPVEVDIPKGQIIGVVKDFHLSSMKNQERPLVLFKREGLWLDSFVAELQPGSGKKALAEIEALWEKHFPNELFDYQYSDAAYQSVYKTELLQARLLSVFTVISLFICSMGLLGLSLLITQRRIKEVGIRKVNGAKTFEIMRLLNWDFLKWVVLAYGLAIPLAYLAMKKWLENFAYQIDLSWWIFGIAGLIILFISLLTVSWESWKAAVTNPVKALRHE